MMSHANFRFSSQRSWVLAVAVLAALWSFNVQQAAARVIDDDCPNLIGNRDLYRKVEWICDDCANIFRDSDIGNLCRRNCFYNKDFLWCIRKTENINDEEQLRHWAAILGAGWN